MTGSGRYRNALLFVLLAGLFGISFVGIKPGLASLPPLLFTVLRFDVAAPPLLLYAAWRYDVWRPRERAAQRAAGGGRRTRPARRAGRPLGAPGRLSGYPPPVAGVLM